MSLHQPAAVDLVVGYIRVSTNEQGEVGLGMTAQEQAIRAAVTARGWRLLEPIRKDVASGKSRDRRPGLEDALRLVHEGTAGTLMVAKLDRLTRSLSDFADVMGDAREHGWNLVALDLGVDLSTPAGEFLASVMASAAQWERRIIGQRTSDALRALQAQGKHVGRPARAFPADVVERVIAQRADGVSLHAIAKGLNQSTPPVRTPSGGKFYPATVQRVIDQAGGPA